jgi:prepilin peptidase CpaA
MTGHAMTAQVWIAILVGLAATIDDLARRRIANWIPVAALAGGFGWQIGQKGLWLGMGQSALGAVAGFGVFLIFYLLGGMGGGDVKLMAGFGALLGPEQLLWAALFTAGVGGVIALAVVTFQAARGVFERGGRLRGDSDTKENKENREASQDGEIKDSIPYAPAITLGVWLALVPKG